MEKALFSELGTAEKQLVYQDPIVVNVAELKDDFQRQLTSDGGLLAGFGENNQTIRIGLKKVPEGSMIEWEEEQLGGEVSTVTWYVLSSSSLDTQGAMRVYELVSAGDFSQLVEQAESAEEVPIVSASIQSDDVEETITFGEL